MKLSLKQLREQADQLRRTGEHLSAIRIHIAILKRNSEDYDTRLQLADALVRFNALVEALKVYEGVAKLCINNGRPLTAIVACRAMEALGKRTEHLILDLSARYGYSSGQKSQRKTRPHLPYEEPVVDAKELRRECTVAKLVEEAVQVGTDLGGLEDLPFKYASIPLLGDLSPSTMVQVIRTILVHRLPIGHVVFGQGEAGSSCYLLARGSVTVQVKGPDGSQVEVASLSDGAIFGEMSLITGSPRSATVIVTDPTDLLELGPASLAAIGDELPRVAKALDRLAQRRWMNNLIQQSPVFKAFGEQERLELLKHFQALEVADGTILLAEGKPAEGIYLVVRGEVGVFGRNPDGSRTILERKGPGSTLGLNAVINNCVSDHKVSTLTPATVLFLSSESVHRLLEAVPEFAHALRDSAPLL